MPQGYRGAKPTPARRWAGGLGSRAQAVIFERHGSAVEFPEAIRLALSAGDCDGVVLGGAGFHASLLLHRP